MAQVSSTPMLRCAAAAALARRGRGEVGALRAAARTYVASVLPAMLFAFVAWARLTTVPDLAQGALHAAGHAEALQAWLNLAHFLLASLFMAVIAVLFLVRRPSIYRRQGWFGDVAAVAGTVSVIGLTSAPRTIESVPALVVANILLVSGILVMLIALGALGRCFGIMPRARGLVRAGVYRFVRHPMYLGEFVAFAGTLVTVLSPYTIAVYALFTGFQLYRIVCEEQTLAAAFPEYHDYRATTSRLIPGVY